MIQVLGFRFATPFATRQATGPLCRWTGRIGQPAHDCARDHVTHFHFLACLGLSRAHGWISNRCLVMDEHRVVHQRPGGYIYFQTMPVGYVPGRLVRATIGSVHHRSILKKQPRPNLVPLCHDYQVRRETSSLGESIYAPTRVSHYTLGFWCGRFSVDTGCVFLSALGTRWASVSLPANHYWTPSWSPDHGLPLYRAMRRTCRF